LELKVFLAGRIVVEGDGVLIDEVRFPGRQGRLLFAYLVAEQGRPVPRDELAKTLWSETPPATWEKSLSVVVSKLRALLVERGVDGANVLTSAFGCYRLNLPEGTWVDVIAAAEAAREAEAALAADDLENAKALATRAASLARQPFLPGEEGAWVDGKRRELTDVLGHALVTLSDACLRSGDETGAAKWAEELIILEPYRETGYRRLMTAHAAAGNRAEALRVYERCRRLLSEELGAYPSPETDSIYRELLRAPSREPLAAATTPIPIAVPEGDAAAGARAVVRRARARGRTGILTAIGSALFLAAAIAAAVIGFTGGSHRGGHLVVASPTRTFNSIDPGFAVAPEGVAALSTIYDGLVGVARQGGNEGVQIVPNLAVSPPLVADAGTRYTFKLRRGIRYSNGAHVRASDFRRAIERLFRGHSQNARFFASLVGADACARRRWSCDLSRGVRTDDTSGRIVFRLRRPDADFLYTFLFLAPIPPGTPDEDVGTRAIASTGPYKIESYVPGRALRLVRNPHFRVWSEAVRPGGFPDEIVFRLGWGEEAQVRAVERGRADVAIVPDELIELMKARYASQVHLHLERATVFLFLNTRLPPFNSVRVRRALNYAVDRAAIARAQGGPELALPTCQLRPPSTVGFRRYCPYTAAPSQTGEWKRPDPARARRLVATSGTRGMKVTVWTFPFFEPAAREVVSTLQRLGYRAALRRNSIGAHFAKVRDEKTRAQAGMWGWYDVPSSPGSVILGSLSCSSIGPERLNANPSFFCDRRIEAQIARALKIQASDPRAAIGLWRRIERELVDLAPWVPLFTPQTADFVSERVGNYQYNPIARIPLDQLWVR
jgi:peptide/nickel transport system substrate-binding protein